MTARPEIPDIGAALAEHIQPLPPEAGPALLAGLERSAATRYRAWAQELSDHAVVLEACAEREEEIARLASVLFPIAPELQARVDAALVGAIAAYQTLFEPHTTLDQLFLQSEAELQGAAAWEGHAAAADDADAKEVLARCSALERENSRALKDLLDKIG